MVKTHQKSRIVTRTLEQQNDSYDIALQMEKTEARDNKTGRPLYLCEVVKHYDHLPASLDSVSAELVRVNKERDRWQRKCERQARRIEQHEAQEQALFNQIQRERDERRCSP